jgi:hypothetical protein
MSETFAVEKGDRYVVVISGCPFEVTVLEVFGRGKNRQVKYQMDDDHPKSVQFCRIKEFRRRVFGLIV